ncbi:hypothetical protein AAC387_Pa09g0959 [Persea americana]
MPGLAYPTVDIREDVDMHFSSAWDFHTTNRSTRACFDVDGIVPEANDANDVVSTTVDANDVVRATVDMSETPQVTTMRSRQVRRSSVEEEREWRADDVE